MVKVDDGRKHCDYERNGADYAHSDCERFAVHGQRPGQLSAAAHIGTRIEISINCVNLECRQPFLNGQRLIIKLVISSANAR